MEGGGGFRDPPARLVLAPYTARLRVFACHFVKQYCTPNGLTPPANRARVHRVNIIVHSIRSGGGRAW
jgi:hypothetical protein